MLHRDLRYGYMDICHHHYNAHCCSPVSLAVGGSGEGVVLDGFLLLEVCGVELPEEAVVADLHDLGLTEVHKLYIYTHKNIILYIHIYYT